MTTSSHLQELATRVEGDRFSRRQVLSLGGLAALAPVGALAEEFPSRAIRLMHGTVPGGSLDFTARLVSQPLSELLRTPVIVESKTGAAGMINVDYVAKSAPDGYTLLISTPSPVLVAPQAVPKPTFNPLADLVAINMLATTSPAVAVNPKLGISRLSELVDLARKRTVTMGLPLPGSVSHAVVAMIAKATGCQFQYVPYRGVPPMTNDMIAGHIDASVSDVPAFLAQHRAGRIKIVAVTSEKRLDDLPDVPTANEDAPGIIVGNWIGVWAPAQTSKPVIQKINDALVQVIARETVRAQLGKNFFSPITMANPEAFQKLVATEYSRYGQVVRDQKIVI